MTAIVIDIGNYYYRLGIWENQPIIIENDIGKRETPSYVSFTNSELFVGETAKNKAKINSKNTIFGINRLLGLPFSDEKIQSNLKYLPYKVIEKHGRPYVQVNFNNEIKEFSPEEIISLLILKMKETAENHLGDTVTEAVITIPASFNSSERKAIINACNIVGINVLQLISGPVATAVCYSYNNGFNRNENILVFDFGRSKYDVSLINIDNGTFKVKATVGNTYFGGEDITNRLIKYIVTDFKNKYNVDLFSNPKAISRLRIACEKAKCVLSVLDEAPIEIECLYDDIDLCIDITRSLFEELISDLIEKFIEPLNKLFDKNSNFSKEEVDEIIFVGASTRIPCFQKAISSYFNGKKINKTVNCDEAVITGSTILASTLTREALINHIKINDIIPHSLDISIQDEKKNIITSNNAYYPLKKIETYSIPNKTPKTISINIYEDDEKIDEHIFNKKFSFHDIISRIISSIIPSKSKFFKFLSKFIKQKTNQIDTIFNVDKNGILTVSVNEKGSKLYKKITNTSNNNNNNNNNRIEYENELQCMTKNIEEIMEINKNEKERKDAMNNLENKAYNLHRSLSNIQNSSIDVNKLNDTVDSIIEWVEDNRNASKKEYENYTLKLEEIDNFIISLA